ncbi:hypothetical protein TL08_20240 [Actinoalloteichus hymeniacidonis]|uniref:Uncharacterized protein n=1 Tax=Actinoalloteichus hymeniacidonis TaxID=340345 RepID=A0AAC9HT37_9PSEU|nr:hypothetical protein TL08_20240 [Actinoalloteichus hymeniacidonis]
MRAAVVASETARHGVDQTQADVRPAESPRPTPGRVEQHVVGHSLPVQTFLPCVDFDDCAAVLDARRLGKQRVEVLQILRALVWPDYGWKNHPAVAMWRGFTRALVCYGVAICEDWRALGGRDTVLPQLLMFTGGVRDTQEQLDESGLLPPWLGLADLHNSHRCALVAKDPEHYRPVFPEVPDGLPYFWPRPVFPHWPLRRGTQRAATRREAMGLLAEPTLPLETDWTVARLAAGRDAEFTGSAPDCDLLAVYAGLRTTGRTLWLSLRGTESELPPPAIRPRRELGGKATARGPAGAAASRQPGPIETAAEQAEWQEQPEFLFLHPPGIGAASEPLPALLDALPADVGLVVLADPPQQGPPAAEVRALPRRTGTSRRRRAGTPAAGPVGLPDRALPDTARRRRADLDIVPDGHAGADRPVPATGGSAEESGGLPRPAIGLPVLRLRPRTE